MRKKGGRKWCQSIGFGLGPWHWAFFPLRIQPSSFHWHISVSVKSTSKSRILLKEKDQRTIFCLAFYDASVGSAHALSIRPLLLTHRTKKNLLIMRWFVDGAQKFCAPLLPTHVELWCLSYQRTECKTL